MQPTHRSRSNASRLGIVVATVIGFGVGATGFAAAQHDDSPEAVEQPAANPSPTTSVEDRPTTTVRSGPAITVGVAPTTAVDDDAPTTSMGGSPSTTIDDGPSTTIDDGPSTTIDDGPTTTIDDGPSTTVDDGPTTTIDDGPSTTIDDGPSTTIDDGPTTTIDDRPTTTLAAALPAPFSTSYASAGGSISVSWSGTAFTLNGVSPAPGFRAEIEHQSWDRVRVDFDGEDRDARIEVRINDGQLRVGID